MPKHRKTIKHNWQALRRKFLYWEGTAKGFAEKHGVAYDYFMKRVKEGGWYEAQAQAREKAAAKVEDKAPDKIADRMMRHIELNDKAIDIVAGKLEKGEKLSSGELRLVVSTLKDLTTHASFASGGPTERVDKRSVHINIADLLEEDFGPGTEA